MPDLLSLPEELLCKISDFVHPQTAIDWACASKILSRCSLQALEMHRQRASDLRVVHDRNPITVPSLLRSSLSDPELLCYVRSLDIWELREKFEEWKSPSFIEGNPGVELDDWNSDEFLDWPEKHHDYSHLNTTFYNEEELERYSGMLSEILHLKESLVEKWMERLRSGSDEPHKVLLMAMSPRLKKATFVEYDSWQSEERSHPFRLLSSTLRALAPLPSPQWPCFQNLKTVTVGHDTELRHPHDAYYPHSGVIAPIFLLPVLEELHLNLLMREQTHLDSGSENDDEDDENPKPYVWEWETARSSCQKLTFHCCELDTKTVASFIGATHSLRSLNGVSNDDKIVSALLEYSRHSLETVSFDDRTTLPTSGALPQHSLQPFEKLTHVVLPASQLVDMSTYVPHQIQYTADNRIDEEESTFGTTNWVDLSTFLPQTLQSLKIYQSHMKLFSYHIKGLVHRLVALVHAKLSTPNGAFASLTEICVANLAVKSTESRWGTDRLDSWLGDLKRACEEANVKVHTRARSTSIQSPSGEDFQCSFCRPSEMSVLDSAPVIPDWVSLQ